MKNILKFGVCMGLAATVAACATAPVDPDLQRTFVPLQAHQAADLGLSCADLQPQIAAVEDSVAALDKQIKRDQEQSQTFAMAAAFSGISGSFANNPLSARLANANVALGNTGSSMSDQQAMNKTQLRANLEDRHEALIQLYYGRGCAKS